MDSIQGLGSKINGEGWMFQKWFRLTIGTF